MSTYAPGPARRGPAWLAALALAGALAGLSGCAPLLVGAAALGGTVLATDPRASSVMLIDQGIEQRAGIVLYETWGNRAHVSVTSYDARVLLSGEVPTEADRQRATELVRGVDNVRQVFNETVVAAPSDFAQRSQDSYLSSVVKTALMNTNGVSSNDVKVVTERGSVYLMGRLSGASADAVTEVARTRQGVQRVVRLFAPLGADVPAPAALPASGAAPAASAAPGALTTPVGSTPVR